MPELAVDNQQRAKHLPISFHLDTLLLNIILIAFSVANWQCHVPISTHYHFCYEGETFWDSKGSEKGAILFVGQLVCIAFYLGECWKSAAWSYLKNDVEIPEYETFINGLKASPPQVGTEINCYHYSRDEDGDKEQTITYTGTYYWNYKSWNDITGEIVGMNEQKILKLELTKAYVFGNAASREEFENHRKDLIADNKHRDEFIGHLPLFEIGGFQSHLLVQNKGMVKPDCMRDFWFWFWSFLMLAWPYRMWFECKTVNKKIVIRKVVYGHKDQETIL